ncbi:6-Hydroxy-D-Nicotine Oxidase protein [Rutstroemia sp. NJR-2017a WRK4]|nr:6-Hydroxy-D-Nicotine Oxidase protein [Rutstroemia sp. NJR-2017a WRK4]
MAAIFPKPTCHQAELLIKAGLKAQILVQDDASYTVRQASYWSNTAKLKPACIVRPRSAEEVSLIIRTLVGRSEKFAVRSGGHTQYAGANNIEGGVTIDLGLLDWTKYDAATETVDIGPGGRWGPVYAELKKHGRVVAGGRDGNVGVAGLLLGGGKTFFTARRGFACDDVIAYEVVLASGEIVTVDASNFDDLFRALKGGMNNFGIVTNFRMKAFKCDEVWAGLTYFPKQVIPGAIEALVDFTDNIPKDLDSNLLCFFTYPEFKDTLVVAGYVQTAGIENAPAYEKWLALPSINTTCQMTSVSDVVNAYAIAPDTFLTACFKNDTRIVAKASELHDRLVEEIKSFIPDGNFITQCLFQPLSKIIGQRSAEAGGNIMGVERQSENGLLFTIVIMVKTEEQETFVYPKAKAWLRGVQEFAATIDGNLDWIFMNYADPSQNPLASYGIENVQKMKDVAAKYDAGEVFQKLCPGGFKISEVEF